VRCVIGEGRAMTLPRVSDEHGRRRATRPCYGWAGARRSVTRSGKVFGGNWNSCVATKV